MECIKDLSKLMRVDSALATFPSGSTARTVASAARQIVGWLIQRDPERSEELQLNLQQITGQETVRLLSNIESLSKYFEIQESLVSFRENISEEERERVRVEARKLIPPYPVMT